MRRVALAAFAMIAGCKGTPATSGPAPPPQPSASAPAPLASATAPPEGAPAEDASAPDPAEPERASVREVAEVLFLGAADEKLRGACPASLPEDARYRCLIDERYRGDAKAAGLAHELWVRHAVVAGIAPSHKMDGGYRGVIDLEPAVPTGQERRHLEWMVAAMDDFSRFFDAFGKAEATGGPARFRFRRLHLRFMRSKKGRTPSAYASGWSVSYNVAGSLWRNADAARETMFHEIFHDNDDDWSPAALGAIYRGILAKCGTRVPCLTPYAPSEIQVRGGTYYSFQPNNGDSVHEYAADLATRFYRENRDTLAGSPPKRPFKCGPPENREAWAKMRDRFFGGRDLVPPCP